MRKIPVFKRWTTVELEWFDSHGTGGWVLLNEADRVITGCHSVGMVEHQDSATITLALSHDVTNGNVCGTITIPLFAVTSWRRLQAS